MHIPIFLVLFATLSLIYLVIGIAAGKAAHTQEEYFLANRTLGLWPLTMTLIATQIGGGMLLGTAQAAYEHGVIGILYTGGIALGFILLGLWFAPRMRLFQAKTNAHVLEIAYGSTRMRAICSIISIITMIGLLVGQLVAIRSIFISLGLDGLWWLVPLTWFIVLLYTLFGGLAAVVATDIVQALVIMTIFIGIVAHSLYTQHHTHLLLTTLFDSLEWHHAAPYALSLLIMPALFSLVEQDLAQRFFSARTAAIASRAALLSAFIIMLFSLIPVFFGLIARDLLPGLPLGASPLLPLFELLGGPIVSAIALCALAAAIISTSDSLLCAASSNVAQDFPALCKQSHTAYYGKIMTGIVGICALIFSYLVPQNILRILVGSYALSVNTLLVPLVAAYCIKKPSRTGAWCALGAGAFSMGILTLLHVTSYNWTPVIFAAFTYLLVAWLSPSTQQDSLTAP